MKVFKTYTYSWWELGLLKISLLALGIIVGSYFGDIFKGVGIMTVLWLIFILPAVYLIIVSVRQIEKGS